MAFFLSYFLMILFLNINQYYGNILSNDNNNDQEMCDYIMDDNDTWEIFDENKLPQTCNIDIITQHESELFLSKYYNKLPVIIRYNGDFNDYHNKMFHDKCGKKEFINEFKNERIILSSSNTYSYDKIEVPMLEYLFTNKYNGDKEYLSNETFYWFGNNNYKNFDKLFKYYKTYSFIPNWEDDGTISFGVGKTGSGVPFHTHGHGLSEVFYGYKQWFLYKQNVTPKFNPNYTTLYWYNNEYTTSNDDDDDVYTCIIKYGDTLYFPANLYHSTLNYGYSIFISLFL